MSNLDPKYSRNSAHTRKKAREKSLQAVYQWDLNSGSAKEIIGQFETTQDMRNVDFDYFKELVSSTIKNIKTLDLLIKPHSKIELEQLDPIERSILRISINELANHFEVPYRVVVNEGIELAKRYGGSESHKFVNGVLDKAAKEIRHAESKTKE